MTGSRPAAQGGVRDTVGEFQSKMAGDAAAAQSAMDYAMSTRDGLMAHYGAQVLPLGGQAGDAMTIPPVPDNATPPAMSDLYPYAGMEPTPASVGFAHGNEPLPQ